MKKMLRYVLPALIALLLFDSVVSYPIDGYFLTGIRRLERLRLILAGKLPGTAPVPGAQKAVTDIRLNLLGARGDSLAMLPAPDPVLQKQIDALFPNRDESYGLAILDITPGRRPTYAVRQENRQYSPGSVGKLAIAAGLFTELSRMFPNSPDRRRQLLRDRMVIADQWINYDEHAVPIFDPGNQTYSSRPAKEGDLFSLYEWVDHMLSASANSAASIVWKETMLMRAFGSDYPTDRAQEEAYFAKTAKKDLQAAALSIVNDPLRQIGIDQKDWQLGSFFTRVGKSIVPGGVGSFATPLGYLKFLVALERGLIADPWSSLEIKRLAYMTARRIRYASSPALTEAAVYFKSGSLYRCKPEDGFQCGKYMGNVENTMNSVAIVEHADGRTYLVGLMSNVLRKNSAVEHQTLATFIDRILKK